MLGVSRVFLKIWSGKERSGEMISSLGALNHGSVNGESKSLSTKKSIRKGNTKKEKICFIFIYIIIIFWGLT
ncbi:hypothetical protein Bca4012_019039 [Brassica carinata]